MHASIFSLGSMLYYGGKWAARAISCLSILGTIANQLENMAVSHILWKYRIKTCSKEKNLPVLLCIQSFQIFSAFCSLYLNKICIMQNIPHLLQHIFLCHLRVVVKCFLDERPQNVLCTRCKG